MLLHSNDIVLHFVTIFQIDRFYSKQTGATATTRANNSTKSTDRANPVSAKSTKSTSSDATGYCATSSSAVTTQRINTIGNEFIFQSQHKIHFIIYIQCFLPNFFHRYHFTERTSCKIERDLRSGQPCYAS